jgi:hypothetical protein
VSPPDFASLSETLLVVKGGAAPSCVPTRQLRRGSAGDGRVRVALRLDEPRHRRLRLAAAQLRKSAQGVIQAAIDHYLERIVANSLAEPCPCLERAQSSGAGKPTLVSS